MNNRGLIAAAAADWLCVCVCVCVELVGLGRSKEEQLGLLVAELT